MLVQLSMTSFRAFADIAAPKLDAPPTNAEPGHG